ncbi:MAG TPA: poly-beta-1,6-N-acetyl-D-glucosamine biosynthesis protein PgaD [Burkholderiales bacterium]|jgi:biofilm PGA synthesis protein PgaD
MDKPGSRYPALNLKSPIIYRPDLQSNRQRTVYGAITVAFWAFWVYLWVPLLALLAWIVGIQQAYKYMVTLGGYQHTRAVLEDYSIVVACLGGTLLIWAAYNIFRFRGAGKRAARPLVTDADIARDLSRDVAQVDAWQRERLLVVAYDDDGRIAHVERQTVLPAAG